MASRLFCRDISTDFEVSNFINGKRGWVIVLKVLLNLVNGVQRLRDVKNN